jgi:hypothetical protein
MPYHDFVLTTSYMKTWTGPKATFIAGKFLLFMFKSFGNSRKKFHGVMEKNVG